MMSEISFELFCQYFAKTRRFYYADYGGIEIVSRYMSIVNGKPFFTDGDGVEEYTDAVIDVKLAYDTFLSHGDKKSFMEWNETRKKMQKICKK